LDITERSPVEEGPAAGALVVCVHGSMDRGASFRRLMSRLADCTIITYDRRGYAGSLDVPLSAEFQVQVDDLVEVLDGRPAVAFGHSFGGDVVLATAEQRPDLLPAVAVFEPPQPWLPGWSTGSAGNAIVNQFGENAAAAAELFMRRMVGDRTWERLPPSTRDQRRAEGAALIADLRALRGQPPFDPSAITVPVILGYGSRSKPHHVEGTQRLAAALPNAELVVVEGSTHGAHLSHASEVAKLVRRALARAQEGAVEP
jgi:pimeloyl-ACP methyl ester carboxylesterase